MSKDCFHCRSHGEKPDSPPPPFFLSLALCYLYLMFLPTVRKFLAGVVTVEVRTEPGRRGLPAPPITFCPSNTRE